jgi:hypothetical protein
LHAPSILPLGVTSTTWGFKPLSNRSSTLTSYCLFSTHFTTLASDFRSRLESSCSTFFVVKIDLFIGKQGSKLDGGGIVASVPL